MQRLTILFVVLLTGCAYYSKEEGDALAQRVDALEAGLSDIAAEKLKIDDAIARLETVLEQATNVVKRNSADLGAEVETMKESMAKNEGKLAEFEQTIIKLRRKIGESQARLNEKIESFGRRAGLDLPIDPSQVPAGEDPHYSAAYKAYRSGDHSLARALFREFVRRYPKSDNVDNAIYWTGRSYLDQQKPANALQEFRAVLRDHSKGDAIDETLFDMASAFLELRACGDAKSALEALLAGSSNDLKSAARKKLRDIRRVPKANCVN